MTASSHRIDMHAHFYGGGLADRLRKRTSRPFLRETANGLEMEAMNGAFPFSPAYYDPEVGLAAMDDQGLTHRLLTFPGALGVDLLPMDDISAEISAFNDHLAELAEATRGRLLGLAGLPLADLDASVTELLRIRRDLGLPGVILPSNYFNSLAEADELRPILDAANDVGCLIMLHPGLKVGQEPPRRPDDMMQYRLSAVDLQSSVSQVALTVILSDALDAHREIAFQIVNLGGTLPFIFERLESIARHRNPDAPFPTERLRRLWFDCASLGPRAVEAAVKLYGADRIMLGSDFPIFKDDPYALAIAPAQISSPEKEQIAWRTADALLRRFGARHYG